MNKIGLMIGSLIMVIGLCWTAFAEDLTARVNIALQDGTVMIYAGARKGVNVGDEFDVDRGGEKVGHLRVTRVKDLFSYCEIIEGEVQEMDTVVRTKSGSASVPSTGDGEEKPSSRRKPAASEKDGGGETAEAAEKPAAESATPEAGSSRSRRREAAKQGDDGAEAPATGSEPDAATEAKTDQKPKKDEKVKEAKKDSSDKTAATSKKRGLSPIGSTRSAAFGLTGNIMIPTANVVSNGKGTGFLTYASSSDKDNDFKDTGFGINYGFGGDIEVALARVSTDYGGDYLIDGESMTGETNVFSFKFQLPRTKAPSFLKNAGEARYAVGLQYFNVKISDEYSDSEKWKATRFFAVGTGEFMGGIGHFGVYSQTGDYVDDTDYQGIGVMGGFEYPLARGEKSAMEGMSLLAEIDSKTMYIDALKSLSLGLRYTFAQRGHVSLSIADITSTKALLFNGGYNF